MLLRISAYPQNYTISAENTSTQRVLVQTCNTTFSWAVAVRGHRRLRATSAPCLRIQRIIQRPRPSWYHLAQRLGGEQPWLYHQELLHAMGCFMFGILPAGSLGCRMASLGGNETA